MDDKGKDPSVTQTLDSKLDIKCISYSNKYNGSPSIRLNALVQQKGITVRTQALMDSGATGVLINTKFTKNKGFMITPLARPIPVTNIDGTRNRTGDIMAMCQMLLSITGKEGHHLEPIIFYLADLGQEDLILGTNWLQLHNPDVNWQTDQITLSQCPKTCFSNPVLMIQGISTWQEQVEFTEEEEETEDQWIPEGMHVSRFD